MTPREARAIAKTMFRELTKIPPSLPSSASTDRVNPEYLERAAVLADVVLQSDHRDVMGESRWLDVGEALALAVRGRVSPYSERFGRLGMGAPLPPGTEATELANAIQRAEQKLFPPRRAPCLPNAKELRELVEREHGTGSEARRQLRRLNAVLREACGYSSYSDTFLERLMSVANDALGGHGVERAAYEWECVSSPRYGIERVVDFYYVNMGDTYNATLIADRQTRRFRISTWGDEVERAERRFGEGGMWRV